jgi:hypothetical protein
MRGLHLHCRLRLPLAFLAALLSTQTAMSGEQWSAGISGGAAVTDPMSRISGYRMGGVLDIRSAMPFAALTMRSLTNERGDFLLTTFPIANVNRAALSPVVFPQIADGGGYITQFILLSPGAAASATPLKFYDQEGQPLAVGK